MSTVNAVRNMWRTGNLATNHKNTTRRPANFMRKATKRDQIRVKMKVFQRKILSNLAHACSFHNFTNNVVYLIGFSMQSSPDQHAALQQYKSLSLIVESAVESGFRSMKKEIQDQFDGKVSTQKYFKLVIFY